MMIVGTIVLWLSICGFCIWLRSKSINMAFAPIITMSSIIAFIFMCGILNVMLYGIYAVLLGGIILGFLAKPIKLLKDKVIGKYDITVLAVFSFVSFLLALRLKGTLLCHYDDFSHWLTVIKEIFKTDKLPNFQSEMIMFQGYPTGSAGVAYMFQKIIGNTDAVALWGQAVVLISCLMCIFAFVKKWNWFSCIVITATAIYSLVANIKITSLLVDSLISLLAIAGFAIMYYYRDDLKKAAVLSLMPQIALITVKNSGLVFLIFNAFCLFLLYILSVKNGKEKFRLRPILTLELINFGLPLFVLFLWNRHVDYVFSNGTTAKHTMSIENYEKVLADKKPEQIKEILSIFADRFFSLNTAVLVILITLIIVIATIFVKRKDFKSNKAEYIGFAILPTLFYLGFMLILALMYILSMPYEESVVLASYDRYEMQVVIYSLAMAVIFVLEKLSGISQTKGQVITKVGIIALILVIISTEAFSVVHLFNKSYTNPEINFGYTTYSREKLEAIKKEHSLPDGKHYFVCLNGLQGSEGYNYFLSSFIFWNPNTTVGDYEKMVKTENLLGNYDYLIVPEESEEISRWLTENQLPLGQTVYKFN